MPAKLSEATGYGTLDVLIPSWELSLQAANKSPKTLRVYGDTARLFATFARDKLGVTEARKVTRETVETFMADQLARFKPTTASVRFRSLQQLWKWLVEEGEIERSPMATMKPPIVPEVPVPVVSDDDLKKLLKVCEGTTFEHKRDLAILRVMCEPGGTRLAEVAGLNLEDVDLADKTIVVVGKGRRPRSIVFGTKTAQALDRYLRLRPRHAQAASLGLWLGPKGKMTDSGIAQMIERRCVEAGIDKIHPHQLRHTAAHVWLADGGGEDAAMRLFGWKSRQMLSRYGASAADGRARDEARRRSLGDRL
ncbi:MAG: integrase [Acidimicrobiaceae bacterium]|nr:integrase [Acidimicrobiaceae bacterium]